MRQRLPRHVAHRPPGHRPVKLLGLVILAVVVFGTRPHSCRGRSGPDYQLALAWRHRRRGAILGGSQVQLSSDRPESEQVEGSGDGHNAAGDVDNNPPGNLEPELRRLQLLDGALVELEEECSPWCVRRLLIPIAPSVMIWLNDSDSTDFLGMLTPCPSGEPHVHVKLMGKNNPIMHGNVEIHGVHSIVHLPKDTMLQKCRLDWVPTYINIEPSSGLGPVRALRIMCPVVPVIAGKLSAYGTPGRALVKILLHSLLPMAMHACYSPSPRLGILISLLLATLGCTCSICAMLLFTIMVKTHCMRTVYRWRRVWQLKALSCRATLVSFVFCEDEPCCICLESLLREEALMALLPCRHVVHGPCYNGWVGSPSYPVRYLRCPLCSCRVEAIGKLER